MNARDIEDLRASAAPPGFSNIGDVLLAAAMPCGLVVENDQFLIRNWRNEAQLRQKLALLAYLHGWHVSEEVVVPGWGRIDIVLVGVDSPHRPILIELKLKLNRPSEARKAYQQTDGYGRWWKATKNQQAELVLAAAEHDAAVTAPVGEAYPEVSLYSVGQLMALFAHWRNPAEMRWRLARARLDEAKRELAWHAKAVADIEEIEGRS